MATETVQSTKVTTGVCRASYAHVWEPTKAPGATDAKYSISLLIPKSDKAQVEKIKTAINAAVEIAKSKNNGKLPKNFKMPLRDGDEERDDDEVYVGHYFLNASSKTAPSIVDRNVNQILDKTEFYSGCYCRAGINFYYFDTAGNKGIAAGLNNLQKVKDGEPLGGKTTPDEDFKDGFKFPEDDDLL